MSKLSSFTMFCVIVASAAIGCGGAKKVGDEPAYSQKVLRAELSKPYLDASDDASDETSYTSTHVQSDETNQGDTDTPTGEPDPDSAATKRKSDQPNGNTKSDSDDGAATGLESRHQALLAGLTIFVLSIFVGFEVITKVPPTLHTPLMSGSNAISGITLVGAVSVTGAAAVTGGSTGVWATLGFIAIVLATINVVGGFLVTHRMLSMFKKR